jgi:hypothetical protein
MEANSEEKQLYIKENVTNKGYDSFLFTQFICKKYNQKDFDINKFSIGQIREAIQEFKNNTPLGKITNSSSAPPLQKQKKKNIIQSILGFINEEEQKSNSPKKNEFDYGFRLPEKLKCQNVEEEYLGQYDDLPIKIGFPEKVDKGFLKKTVTYFTAIAVPLGKVVKRSFEDFEWLRNKLTKMFDYNFIPSLPKINPILGIENEEETTRGLEKFMHYLSLDPIIKNSQILYDFLSIENYEQFKKQQKEYEIITPCTDIQEFKSITGEINIDFTEEQENNYKNIKEFCNQNKNLLEKLNNNLNMLYHEMNNVIKRTNEIANIWGYLYKTSEKYKDDNLSQEIYYQMNNMFFNLSKNFKKQNDFINIDIKESFIFMQNNYGSINELIKRIDNKKKIYTKEEKELIALKEELFMTRNTPGHQKSNINIEVGKKNAEGEFDLSTFLPMNTKALLEMKKSYGFYLNKFLVEYNRMKKMNNVIYRDKIQRCYKTQNSIASELCACVENLLSSMDMYTTNENWETPTGDNKIDKPKIGKENNKKQNNKEKKDENKKEVDNKNEINEKKEKENINENKINEQSVKNEINNENKDTEKINIEESGFNLIKDDNNANDKK